MSKARSALSPIEQPLFRDAPSSRHNLTRAFKARLTAINGVGSTGKHAMASAPVALRPPRWRSPKPMRRASSGRRRPRTADPNCGGPQKTPRVALTFRRRRLTRGPVDRRPHRTSKGPQPKMNTPDFLCIGAQKGGTTWLFEVLSENREIWLGPFKEAQYFNSLFVKEVNPMLDQKENFQNQVVVQLFVVYQ